MPNNQPVTRDSALNRKRIRQCRLRQKAQGVRRIEISLDATTAAHFEELVAAKTEDYPLDQDQRQRKRLAKTAVFKAVFAKTLTSFVSLKDRIQQLEAEIRALTPSFLQAEPPGASETPVVPEVIQQLTDNPVTLKRTLARIYQQALKAQHSLVTVSEELRLAKRSASRYQEITEQLNEKIIELEGRLTQQSGD